jgi:hypothetical protein
MCITWIDAPMEFFEKEKKQAIAHCVMALPFNKIDKGWSCPS